MTHLRDLSTALAAAVPAVVLIALAMVCAVLGVAVMVAVSASLAGARLAMHRRPQSRPTGSGMVLR